MGTTKINVILILILLSNSSFVHDSEKTLILDSKLKFYIFLKNNEISYTSISIVGSKIESVDGFDFYNDSIYIRINQNVNLTELSIQVCHLNKISDKLFKNNKIIKLLLDGNNINICNPNIKLLTNLRELSLNSNNITNLEQFALSVLTLKNLVYLTFNDNKITYIPKCILKIRNLNSLFLSWNKIETIPCWLSQKEEFDLHLNFNLIKEIPCCFNK